jgi:hypothetical protein
MAIALVSCMISRDRRARDFLGLYKGRAKVTRTNGSSRNIENKITIIGVHMGILYERVIGVLGL